jgi:hypothetical protein
LPGDAQAKAFVVRHHYSASYPAARRRYGLFGPAGLEGVAVFSVPCNDRVLTGVFAAPARQMVELGRFVLLDEVGFNAESWMLARCLELLRQDGFRGVVSFCDPVPRTTADGRVATWAPSTRPVMPSIWAAVRPGPCGSYPMAAFCPSGPSPSCGRPETALVSRAGATPPTCWKKPAPILPRDQEKVT